MPHKTMPCQIQAASRYNKLHTVTKQVRLNKKYDADIISFLEGCDSQMGFIKDSIRLAMANSIRERNVLFESKNPSDNNLLLLTTKEMKEHC